KGCTRHQDGVQVRSKVSIVRRWVYLPTIRTEYYALCLFGLVLGTPQGIWWENNSRAPPPQYQPLPPIWYQPLFEDTHQSTILPPYSTPLLYPVGIGSDRTHKVLELGGTLVLLIAVAPKSPIKLPINKQYGFGVFEDLLGLVCEDRLGKYMTSRRSLPTTNYKAQPIKESTSPQYLLYGCLVESNKGWVVGILYLGPILIGSNTHHSRNTNSVSNHRVPPLTNHDHPPIVENMGSVSSLKMVVWGPYNQCTTPILLMINFVGTNLPTTTKHQPPNLTGLLPMITCGVPNLFFKLSPSGSQTTVYPLLGYDKVLEVYWIWFVGCELDQYWGCIWDIGGTCRLSGVLGDWEIYTRGMMGLGGIDCWMVGRGCKWSRLNKVFDRVDLGVLMGVFVRVFGGGYGDGTMGHSGSGLANANTARKQVNCVVVWMMFFVLFVVLCFVVCVVQVLGGERTPCTLSPPLKIWLGWVLRARPKRTQSNGYRTLVTVLGAGICEKVGGAPPPTPPTSDTFDCGSSITPPLRMMSHMDRFPCFGTTHITMGLKGQVQVLVSTSWWIRMGLLVLTSTI
ncbi:hypothetical protein G9A89_000389, partial [Geosiphon pyriformis]